jgi:hypothetical protein
MKIEEQLLPRLAVISDVPVERTHAGMLLIYRLLEEYPPDRLLIINSRFIRSGGNDSRLPNVTYRNFDYPGERSKWVPNRLNSLWKLVAQSTMSRHSTGLIKLIEDFRPDAILTIADYLLWIAAAASAAQMRIPLHLIIHDDYAQKMTGHSDKAWATIARRAYKSKFRRIFVQSTSRLSISPNMADKYKHLYGVESSVLYPNRGNDSPTPQLRVSNTSRPITIAFAGSTNVGGVAYQLKIMATLLQSMGGELHLYTKDAPQEIERQGIVGDCVKIIGFLPPKIMAEEMGKSVTALFLPASFEPSREMEVSTLFPSKLADYTAIGIPIIIWGPSYSSAARWGLENPDAALTITKPSSQDLLDAITLIANDHAKAVSYAKNAIESGLRYFDAKSSRCRFYKTLVDTKQGHS